MLPEECNECPLARSEEECKVYIDPFPNWARPELRRNGMCPAKASYYKTYGGELHRSIQALADKHSKRGG